MPFALTVLVYVLASFIALLEGLLIYKMFTDKIDLSWLLAADDGRASLSRLQFLIFTFVIAGGIVYLTIQGGGFPEIDEGVLVLLGISGASYALGKTIDNQTPTAPTVATAGGSGTVEPKPPQG